MRKHHITYFTLFILLSYSFVGEAQIDRSAYFNLAIEHSNFAKDKQLTIGVGWELYLGKHVSLSNQTNFGYSLGDNYTSSTFLYAKVPFGIKHTPEVINWLISSCDGRDCDSNERLESLILGAVIGVIIPETLNFHYYANNNLSATLYLTPLMYEFNRNFEFADNRSQSQSFEAGLRLNFLNNGQLGNSIYIGFRNSYQKFTPGLVVGFRASL